MVALSDGFSDTASMTKSREDNVDDEISVVDDTRALISSDSDDVSRSFCTSFFNRESESADTSEELLMKSILFCNAAGSLSINVTSSFAFRAATRAIPSPYHQFLLQVSDHLTGAYKVSFSYDRRDQTDDTKSLTLCLLGHGP